MPSSSTPDVNYRKEVRFAVVMYGGVSLAIYINGVAQELLRMVRATAQNADGKALLSDNELSGSERVYRKLSYLVAEEPDDDQSEKGDQSGPIPTRFVVDTITGASAGGINGIFLAKALVRGQQIDRLQELWIREGAIEKLLNDKLSKDPPVGFDNPPAALLNAKRMYLELLKALDEMDGLMAGTAKQNGGTIKKSKPLLDELDLFVTATDLRGAVLPMRLTDEVVFERRHKNVFRFVFPRDNQPDPDVDFLPETNPFLAYAARCTSSFPFAFEPMMLTDIDPILDDYGPHADDPGSRSGSSRWSRFFRDYEKASGLKTVPPQKRAFADGGDLDNKPFGNAIDTLTRRHADYPVTRKLIYVEPSPEHPEDEPENDQRPNFFENAIDALSTLPMYQTIREDLQRVSVRNRLVVRINRVLENVDIDAEKAIQSDGQNVLKSIQANHEKLRALTDGDWSMLYLDDMIKRKGRGYAAYHRLEIASVTDDLARIVTRGAGLDDDSDYFAVNRSLTRAWRD
jgi:patatin-related protein